MKTLRLFLFLTAFLVWVDLPADDLISRLKDTQDHLSKLKETLGALITAKEQSENSENLYIPVKAENDWMAVPFAKNDLEALMNIWILWENETAQQAAANAQSIIDFSSNYRTALNDKLNEVGRQIEIKMHEIQALSQQLEKNKSETQPAKSTTVITYNSSTSPGPQPKNRADVTIAVENVKPSEKPGYKKWDFEWVFTEHNGIGLTLTSYELFLRTSAPGSEKVIKNNTQIRIEGGHVFRGPGFMSVEIPDLDHKEESDLHAQLHAVYRGKDDKDNDITVENYFFQ